MASSSLGCGQQDRELVVGNYTDEQTIVYAENRVTDEEKIEGFKMMIETSSITNERPEGLPQYVVIINNPAEFTMELMVNFWITDSDEFVFLKVWKVVSISKLMKNTSRM
ncbi:MAG: hypothetical protein WBV10_06500 [Exiguobacterium marinum]|uniref:hypothetical protein n=1 Tax=Exiguobacterium marinum TaxID=273528 RepID=UPI003C5111F4